MSPWRAVAVVLLGVRLALARLTCTGCGKAHWASGKVTHCTKCGGSLRG